MIYLIGGSPRCGKTILSKKLAQKLGVQWFACDALRPVVMAYTPKEEYAEKFPVVKMYDDNECDNDVFFEENSAEEILNADIIEAKTLWRGIKEFIGHKAVVEKDIIIEGVQLLPELIDELRKEKYFKDTRIVYLTKEDEQKILDGFAKNTSGFDWLTQNIKDNETLPRAARMVKVYSEYFNKEAKKYGFEVFNTDYDFEKNLEKAITCLVQ